MPNIITHCIFCEEVAKTIKNETYKNIIEKNTKEYHIGANGPDFLFFYDFYPLRKKQDTSIPNIGTTFHNKHINDFYNIAIESYQVQPKGELKDAMASYLIAHYLHWQLDSVMHPYVVYKTGFKEKNSKYFHHRFESMMDTIMLDRFRNTTIKEYQTFKNCWISKYSEEAIANIYIPCAQQCLNVTITQDTIQKALEDWEKAQRYLYDPKGWKFRLLKVFEHCIHQPWLYSGNIVRSKIDRAHDIMNDHHRLWLHPCTGAQSKESVTDLFDRAIKQAQIGTELLFAALDAKENTDAFLAHLDNCTYSNGINEELPRIHKEVIYRK